MCFSCLDGASHRYIMVVLCYEAANILLIALLKNGAGKVASREVSERKEGGRRQSKELL